MHPAEPFPRFNAPEDDPLRRWAALEGKSASMCEDLYRRYRVAEPFRLDPFTLAGLCGKLLSAITSTLWNYGGG